MMSIISTEQNSDWRLWSVGLLASLAAYFVCPIEDIQYGYSGLLVMLFYWGLLRSENSQPVDALDLEFS